MRSPWMLGAAIFALAACGPSREETLPPRDSGARDAVSDARGGDGGTSTMDAGGGCPTGATRCGADCVNLNTSTQHCGACNAACRSPATCMMGRCGGGTMCTAPQRDCGGRCVDVSTDSANCGACGVMCPSGQSCQSGMCRAGGCAAPMMMCGTACVDVRSSSANCGRCGNMCPSGQSCVNGACQAGGSMCIDPCMNNEQCQSTCGAPPAGHVYCCAPGSGGAGGVCFAQSGSSCGGGGTGDGGLSGDSGGGGGDGGLDLLGCVFGTVRCASNADCVRSCPGLAETCSGGTCR